MLDYLAAARFDGAEAADFLQAQLSADIGALEPGDAGFACYCSPKGKVYGLLLVGRVDGGFLLIGSAGLLPAMLDRLRMFVFRSKVEFAMEDSAKVYGLTREESATAEEALLPVGLPVGYMVSNQAGAAASDHGFKALEISSQITWLNSRTTEKFIPQMLGFEDIGAVSFTKGCYPGQEIVARARYLGKVKRQPELLTTVTEAEFSSGERVELKRGEEWVKATVIDGARNADGVTHLFVIAPSEPATGTSEISFDGQVYRCATT